MAGETVICVVGNVVDEQVQLRYTSSGKAVANFRIASTPRTFDRQANEWRDGESLFLTCNAWGPIGENAAGSLTKGMRGIVQGRLKQRSFDDREGNKRTAYEVDVDDVGPSLRSATAVVTKSQGGGRAEFQQARRAQGQASAEDPWASSQPAAAGGGGWGGQGGGYTDSEPPF
jgi:single-strand DNA-binding protein